MNTILFFLRTKPVIEIDDFRELRVRIESAGNYGCSLRDDSRLTRVTRGIISAR